MLRKYTLLLLLTIASLNMAHAQFGKFLKDKLNDAMTEENREKLKEKLNDHLSDARADFDATSFNYAISLSDNAGLYDVKEKGEGLLKLTSNLKSEEDKTDAERARGLLDLGEALYASGNLTPAKTMLDSARAEYERHELTDDVNYPKTIANLGLLYSTMGRYTSAEEYIKMSMDIYEKRSGMESSGYAASVNNLAVLYKETGQFNEAEKAILRAEELIEKADGKMMAYVIAQNNKAMLYQTMGRYDEALKTMDIVIKRSAALQNEKSGNHQKFLTNLALLYQEMGQYEKAETAFKEVIALKERRFGKRHPDYAHMLNNLAALYVTMGRTEKVESLLNEAIKIYEDKFGKEHRLYADAISNLGNFYRSQGNTGKAEPLLQTALGIRETALGTNHPSYVQSKEDLAILYWKMDDISEASRLYEETLEQTLTFINEFFPPMSEAEKTKYWDKLRPRFERFYSFATATANTKPEIMGDVCNYHLATKGLLLNTTSKIKQQILNGTDTQLKSDYLAWLDQKEHLSRLYGYSKEELKEQNIDLGQLESETNAAEKALSQRSDIFSKGYQLKSASYKDVRAKLTTADAAVELIRFRAYENNFTEQVNYLAMVIKKEQTAQPDFTLIDNGSQLESRYFKYYNNAIKQKVQDDYSYDQYWAKLDEKVKGKTNLYLSLDGIYNQVSLNSLRMASGSFVIDKYNLVLLSNTKILAEAKPAPTTSKSVTLIGFPEYGGGGIAPLPGTKIEVDNISKLLKSKYYKVSAFTGTTASETNFKKLKSPRILHVATHGYFMEDKSLSGNSVFGVAMESAKDNPLLRSGLLLSGAAGVMSANNASMESNDNGILTAYEAMNLSLENTELVVLSACETGVGAVKAGEGVYGLQRAFLTAGAHSLIMSLWKVDDAATQQLMTVFYTEWLKTGNKQQAFKKAQLALKTKYKDPYYWGAFVLIS